MQHVDELKRLRPKFLLVGVSVMLMARLLDYGMGKSLGADGLEITVRLIGNVFGGLLWGYAFWWVWSRWRGGKAMATDDL